MSWFLQNAKEIVKEVKLVKVANKMCKASIPSSGWNFKLKILFGSFGLFAALKTVKK